MPEESTTPATEASEPTQTEPTTAPEIKSNEVDQSVGQQGSQAAESALPGGQTQDVATEADEGTEDIKAEEKKTDQSPKDDAVFKVDDEELTFGELKDAHRIVAKAAEEYEKAKNTLNNVRSFVGSLEKTPADALLQFFTARLGDGQKAYNHIVDLATKILNKHLELEAMPEAERAAMQHKNEVTRLQAEVAKYKEQEDKRKSETAEIELANQYVVDIKDALKKAGAEISEKRVSQVAQQMLEDEDAGLQATPESSLRRLVLKERKTREAVLRGLKPEDLPDEVRKAVRTADVAAVAAAKSTPQAKTDKRPEPKTGETEERNPNVVSMEDFYSGRWRTKK